MKRNALVVLVMLLTNISFSQTDSTDILLTTTIPTLETEMDSIIFGNGNYMDYLVEFTISDTTDFGSVFIEFSTITGAVLYRHNFTLNELQSKNLIDGFWLVSLNLGRFETGISYRLGISIGNYNGVMSPSISKLY